MEYKFEFPIRYLRSVRNVFLNIFEYGEVKEQNYGLITYITIEDIDEEYVEKINKFIEEIKKIKIPYNKTIEKENDMDDIDEEFMDDNYFDSLYDYSYYLYRPEISNDELEVFEDTIKNYKNIKDYNHDFNPIECDKDDECFRYIFYEWNITKLLKYLEDNNYPIKNINKKEYVEMINNFINVDESNIDKVTFEKPVIIIEMNDNPIKHLLIDGNHRIRKAVKENYENIKGYVVSFKDQIKFLTTTTDPYIFQVLMDDR